ncbi:MAG: hypothetical protein WCI81_07255 [Chlorobiaceae bacterium]
MSNQLELLEAEALKLSAAERAAFAQLLLASLDEDAEIESGTTRVIPLADALALVRAALK